MGSEMLSGFVQLAGIEFGITFELLPVTQTCGPAAFTSDRVGLCGWKMFAVRVAQAWAQAGEFPQSAAPNANPFVPPNSQAAKKVGPQPGSVQVAADPRGS
jgi:hypothetical protein